MEKKIKNSFRLLLPVFTILFLSSFTYGQSLKSGKSYKGIASFYAKKFNGKLTANGETFYNTEFTCAHKSLPFGTILLVENTRNGKKVIVRVNDRGPYIEGRDIDLSFKAAMSLGFTHKGVAKVKIQVLDETKTTGKVEEKIDVPIFNNDSTNTYYSILSESYVKSRHFNRY